MNESDLPDLRIGNADREKALAALGEHMSAGRLDIDEYSDRSARVTTARTRGELVVLFADLPAPKPVFDAPAPAVQPGPEPAVPAQRPGWRGIPPRFTGPLIGVAWVSAIVIGHVLGWTGCSRSRSWYRSSWARSRARAAGTPTAHYPNNGTNAELRGLNADTHVPGA